VNSLDEHGRSGRVGQRFADLADARLEHGLSDVNARPHGVQKLVLADQPAGPAQEIGEHRE
jgi:hypothetical protein